MSRLVLNIQMIRRKWSKDIHLHHFCSSFGAKIEQIYITYYQAYICHLFNRCFGAKIGGLYIATLQSLSTRLTFTTFLQRCWIQNLRSFYHLVQGLHLHLFCSCVLAKILEDFLSLSIWLLSLSLKICLFLQQCTAVLQPKLEDFLSKM